jgi:Adenosine-deaminase (editase) domain
VRDCHAEVLARRGLLKYLHGELNRVLKAENNDKKKELECCVDKDGSNVSDGDEGIKDREIENNISDNIGTDLSSSPVSSHIRSTSNSKSNTPNYSITGFEPFTVNPATGLLKLKEDYTMHLYTSSQPCGNATIKKWAKGKKAKRLEFRFRLCVD